MKKIIKNIFRYLLKLLIAICLLIVIIVALSLAFPEKITKETVKYFAPDIYYSVGTIAWRKNGADLYDLKVILPGITSLSHRVSIRINRENYFKIDVTATDSLLYYSPAEFPHKEVEAKKHEPSYFDNHPIKFTVRFTNLSVKTVYGITGNMNFIAAGFLPKLLIENFNCSADFSGREIIFNKKSSAENLSAKINLLLTNPLDFDYKPKDKILYFLKAFKGDLHFQSEKININKAEINDIKFKARLQSGEIKLDDAAVNIFDGKADFTTGISRIKVKGKNKWRFKYDVTMNVTNINALDFCNAFNLKKNKLSGNFSGWVSTMVFGKSVMKLDGKLWSDNPGILYFPEAEKYIAGMKESMQKQIFDIMVERLKVYPYDVSVIYLKYDLSKKMTEVDFQVKGIDVYKFKLFYNRSWIDAINLARSLR